MENSLTLAWILSGGAHVYYALFGILALSVAILFGAGPLWAAFILALASGVFADLWAHEYLH